MKRVLVSVMVVCLVLSACGGQATPDPTEVARLVDQAVRATVAAMPTPKPQTVEVEKIVKETVIVEKPVEVTVIVEKETIVTPTPEPPTPTPELTIEDVVPADARASAFVSGNASPELPAGELGEVVIIALGQFAGKSFAHFVARNNTTEAVRRIGVSAVARAADGSMFAVGEGDAYDPNIVNPGEIAFGYVYFEGAELPSDVTMEFDVSYTLVKDRGFENIRDLEIPEFELIENRIVGTLQNPYDETISGPIGVQVHCFDQQGNVLSTYEDYTPKDEIEPKGTIPYQVALYGECPIYLITASGFSD